MVTGSALTDGQRELLAKVQAMKAELARRHTAVCCGEQVEPKPNLFGDYVRTRLACVSSGIDPDSGKRFRRTP